MSEFVPLAGGLEGYFDKVLDELPDALRKRVLQNFPTKYWDEWTPDQRRSEGPAMKPTSMLNRNDRVAQQIGLPSYSEGLNFILSPYNISICYMEVLCISTSISMTRPASS
jgi:hypothetical protein